VLRLRVVALPARRDTRRAGRYGHAARLAGRDVLVQRAGHPAGVDDARVRAAVAQRGCGAVMTRAPGDHARRARYLAEVLGTLYPFSDGGGPSSHFVAVPNGRRARLLVPVGSRRVA